jgi:hypothetical protein
LGGLRISGTERAPLFQVVAVCLPDGEYRITAVMSRKGGEASKQEFPVHIQKQSSKAVLSKVWPVNHSSPVHHNKLTAT